MSKSWIFAAGVAALAMASQASAAIVNVSAAGPAGTTVSLAAGTYTVTYAGIADGATYDGWNPWSTTAGCDGAGTNCSQGFLNAFAIDFGFGVNNFNHVDGYQFGYVATPGNSGKYENAAQALTAYRALPISFAALPDAANTSAYTLASSPITFTLASAQQVNFFILDNPYGDNVGGVSLFVNGPPVSGGAVPEPATWAMMIGGFGLIGGALRVRRRTFSFA